MAQAGSSLAKLQALNEYQTQYFGFTTKAMVDTHYNCLVKTWGEVVDSALLPAVLAGTEREEKVDKLRVTLLNQLFQKGRLDIILQKFEESLVQYVFRIPRFVTLPEDLPNTEVEEDDEFDIEADTEEIMRDILKLRVELAAIKKLRANVQTAIQVRKAIAAADDASTQ